MDKKTSEIIFEIANEIEEALNQCQITIPNSTIPRRIQFLASKLSGRDHYAAEKAYHIHELSQIFYSARKHNKYPGGADALWTEMTFDLLNRIRSQGNVRERNGD